MRGAAQSTLGSAERCDRCPAFFCSPSEERRLPEFLIQTPAVAEFSRPKPDVPGRLAVRRTGSSHTDSRIACKFGTLAEEGRAPAQISGKSRTTSIDSTIMRDNHG